MTLAQDYLYCVSSAGSNTGPLHVDCGGAEEAGAQSGSQGCPHVLPDETLTRTLSITTVSL